MKRQVFFSFHYGADSWRVSQVRNMGVVEGDSPFSDNGWEQVRKYTDESIKRWIGHQMNMRSCVVVLVGAHTAERKWVRYEIEEGWKRGKGICAIDVHNLKDYSGNQSAQGQDPTRLFYVDRRINLISCRDSPLDDNEVRLSSICPMHRLMYSTSQYVYDEIKTNISSWIEEAIAVRQRYPMP